LLINFEGYDGVGKTTQIALLKDYLERRGNKVFVTRQNKESIYEEILQFVYSKKLSAKSKLFQFLSFLNEIVQTEIKPALMNGYIVITDRYIASTLAYQGYGEKLGLEIYNIAKYAVDNYIPDVTILLTRDDYTPQNGHDKHTISRIMHGYKTYSMFEPVLEIEIQKDHY